ncbi:MAG TPA: glucosidase [Chitinophagaceae bacterium]|jgi:mannosylglycerate hydrolase MGH1-like protein|nr:glucosidase [Chitinophagaceae bacterium]
MNTEQTRLKDLKWKKWGPYLTDRQWGTVREDYSEGGQAWDFITHDMARSKAYRWGEEGIAGISDDQQLLCFALALWNKKDPILKERFFGVTGSEGNHGEDVKEYYFYVDSTPTHSYMKMLYKYPQVEYPYSWLVNENRRRSRTEPEFELIDTGIFNEDKYFDVFVEYAKNDVEDILIKVSVANRGKEEASLHVLPTLWFRNTWTWGYDDTKPLMFAGLPNQVVIVHKQLTDFNLYCEGQPELLFTDNETNAKRLYDHDDEIKYCKDGINDYLTVGSTETINHEKKGTKASADYDITVAGGSSYVIRLRLIKGEIQSPFQEFDAIFDKRKNEADEFYHELQQEIDGEEAKLVQRQALAGMMWGKQFYYFNVKQWLNGDPSQPPPPASRKQGRNKDWPHMKNAEIISMPDKWEYPWFAAWDLAFHCIPISLIDPDFAKNQLSLLTKEWYMHPNGQIPAYEWAFGDVNPPIHPWACYFVYLIDREFRKTADVNFLKETFHKLLLNFTWWVNRKDPNGKNVFEGGFLGLDNIGVFDRSAPLPTGGRLEQADGTAWMAFYCQIMLQMSLELTEHDPVYEEMAIKFADHFFWIASAMSGNGDGTHNMWDKEDQFFYDVLCLPGGQTTLLKVRSLVGILPLCAATVFPPDLAQRYPEMARRVLTFLGDHSQLTEGMTRRNEAGTVLLSIMDETKLRSVLRRVLDESEFLSPYGIRSISRYHATNPYIFYVNGEQHRVDYWPAESESFMFGGNSNWRGPIWFPINALIVRALHNLHLYYGDNFKIECPTGSGNLMNLSEVAEDIASRLTNIFIRDESGKRALYDGIEKFQNDPHWRDYLMFFEYFHGDTGAGVGANHQTGWSGFVAALIQLFRGEGGQKFLKRREEKMKTHVDVVQLKGEVVAELQT